jgi:molybdopterin-biosynthesis enzyme MoeA-like protein
MNSKNILQAIQSKIDTFILLGGLSRDDATTKAIAQVAKEYQLSPTSIPELPKATPARGRVVDAQIRADAAFMREYLTRPLGVEITGIYAEGDIADFTDEQLEQVVKDLGFAP